jgi:hypothetical protein
MLRDFVAADRAAGRLRIAATLVALVAAIAAYGCGIKGPLRLPTPPPAPATAPASEAPAAPAGSVPVPTAEPEQPPPRKP